jgi:hypothetical protein
MEKLRIGFGKKGGDEGGRAGARRVVPVFPAPSFNRLEQFRQWQPSTVGR